MDNTQTQKNIISNDDVDISVILDRSGSMSYEWKTTIATLSDFLFKQREAFPKGTYSITTFNNKAEVYVSNVNLSEFKGISPNDIIPDGLTALYSAIIKTCQILRLQKPEKRKFVVVVTDGQDNQSDEGSQKTAYDIVSEQKKDGVEFFFLGAGIDSFTESRKIGIPYAVNISLGSGPNDLGGVMRQLSNGICKLVRTRSTTKECPELLRTYTEPIQKKVDKKSNKVLSLVPLKRTHAVGFIDMPIPKRSSNGCFYDVEDTNDESLPDSNPIWDDKDDENLPENKPVFSKKPFFMGNTNSDGFVDINKR